MIINWNDVIKKYPELGTSVKLDAEEVNKYHVPYAVAELESLLGGVFSAPFAATNRTARDLSVDLCFVRLTLGKLEKANAVWDKVMKMIEMLKSGDAVMLDDDGSVIHSGEGMPWSSDLRLRPVFRKPEGRERELK